MMTPRTEAELAAMVAGATRRLQIIGGGTRSVADARETDVLTARGLSGITLYEPGSLTLSDQAGTPVE